MDLDDTDAEPPPATVEVSEEPLLHRFNLQLPYRERIPAEGEKLLADVIRTLTSFDPEQDVDTKVFRGCSGLERIRDLKYSIDDDSRLLLARTLYGLVFPAAGEASLPWRAGNKVMSALKTLIGKKAGRLALEGRLTLPWRPMLDALEEAALRGFPLGSGSNETSRLQKLLPLIRDSARYWAPGADREIWDEMKDEVRQVQTHQAFRALFQLCLFLPSRPGLYDELLPEWFSLWGKVDHCAAWDGAWFNLFCRARNNCSGNFDWTPYMADIYSSARACVHTPISMGDAGSAPLPGTRTVAYQYKAFAPMSARSDAAKLHKLGKLLVFLLGKGGAAKSVRVADVAIVPPIGFGGAADEGEGGCDTQRVVSPAALDLLSLFRSLRTYFHPSNGGRWSVEMANLMACVCRSLAWRVGSESALREVGQTPPAGELTRDDAALVVEALLPLVMEMVYSKNYHVRSCSNFCLSALAALSPKSVAPAAAELILRALDPVASINHTHQAPAAIRALTSIFQPLMHPRPYLAPYLPAILELSLPGVDPNDVFKTAVTLQMYHTILCWLPVQGNNVDDSDGSLEGWMPAPPAWLDASDTLDEVESLYTACENLGGAMMDWSAALLDRLLEVLRHKDKTSKVKAGDLGSDTMNVSAAMAGLGSSGFSAGGGMHMASMLAMAGGGGGHSLLTGGTSLVTQQLFTMMDESAGEMASAKILRFVTDGAQPNVEKDVAAMIESMAWARPERTVATLFPALCDGLLATGVGASESTTLAPGVSTVVLRWRLRLLSGLARGAGTALVPQGAIVRRLIAGGLIHKDKSVRKSARKLLRKTLHGLCRMWPTETRSLPPSRWANVNSVAEWRRLCEPVPPGEHAVTWNEPGAAGLTLAAQLLQDFLAQPTQELSAELSKELAESGRMTNGTAASTWREQLKTMDYAVRGAVSMLGDRGTPGEDDRGAEDCLRDDVYLAVGGRALLTLKTADGGAEGPRLFSLVAGLRAEISRFLQRALDACAHGKGPADVKSAKLAIQLSQRIACTRGAEAHLVRRQRMAMVVFKMQHRDVLSDSTAKTRLDLALEAAASGDAGAIAKARRLLATAGMGGGLSCPRVLVIGRVVLQHWKRLSLAPRAMAFAMKDAARTLDAGDGDLGEDQGDAVVPWPAASAVLGRYRALYSALVDLSSAEYAMVRAAAQFGVARMGGVFPWIARSIVPALISQLSPGGQEDMHLVENEGSGDAAHRRLTGACYLLHQTRSMRYAASKWSLLRALLLALCDSQVVVARLPNDKQEKAAARVTILFTDYVSTWRANPILNEKDKAEHDTLLGGLLARLAVFKGAAPSAGGGWRYQLMASWCLLHLIRPAGSSTRSGLRPSGTTPIADLPSASTPPMAMWRWFTECLSEGDGQPLQRLALGALSKLLSAADSTAPGGDDVSDILRSREFLKPFFRALAHNHKKEATEGGSTGGEQWSLGVKEVLQDAGRGDTRELFPRLRFTTRSRLFWARNARLVSSVIMGVVSERRGECVRVLLREVCAAKASTAHEDKRSFDCAAAEVGAGVVAAVAGEGSDTDGKRVLREIVLPFIEAELEGVSLEGRLDWTDAIRFALDSSSAECSEPLVVRVVERTTAVLQGGGKGRDDYSVLVKWLSFMGAALIELSARKESASRAEGIARKLCPLLVEGLDHPFKACREEIARNLFVITNVTDAKWAVDVADGVRESIAAEAAAVEEGSGQSIDGEREVANGIATLVLDGDKDEDAESVLLASVMAMSDGGGSGEQEALASREAKRLSLRRETVLQWLHQTTTAGDHARYLPIFVALLPVALQCVRDSNVEVADMGRGASLSSAAALITRSPKTTGTDGDVENTTASLDTGGVIDAVLSAASSQSSWRVRRNAAAVACVLQTRLHFVLMPMQHAAIDRTILALLGDPRREVQETARLTMSTRVTHLTPAQARALCERFAAEADSAAASRKKRRRIAKRQATAARAGEGAGAVANVKGVVTSAVGKATGEEDDADALKAQQTSVLGLSAVVLASPCDVPSWLPGALESLAQHANDESPGRLPVRQTVTHTFKEFRRTHQDKWAESHKARFTRDQLDTFDDVLGGAHSYFV